MIEPTMMDISQLARVGDTIETHVRQPQPGRIQVQLRTPEACAYANQLLLRPAKEWALVSRDGLKGKIE